MPVLKLDLGLFLFVSSIGFHSSVPYWDCIFIYTYIHTQHNRYDSKSSFELILYTVKGPDFLDVIFAR